jgi:hypothetical protein
VKALVGAKAALNTRRNDGRTALNRAIDNDHTSVAEYLKSVGAKEEEEQQQDESAAEKG